MKLLEKIFSITNSVFYNLEILRTNYRINKEYKYSQVIDFPPVPKLDYNRVVNENLININSTKEISDFIDILKTISGFDGTILYNNLVNLRVKIKDINEAQRRSKAAAFYLVPKNEINILRDKNDDSNNNFGVINHELLHLSSSIYDIDSDNIEYVNVGFYKFCKVLGRKNLFKIGIGLNEGYTERLNKKFFKNKLHAYVVERKISEFIEDIIGEEKMHSLYFTCDLEGLVNELSLYDSKENIFRLLFDIDFIYKYRKNYNSKRVIPSHKLMIETTYRRISRELLICYYRKIQLMDIDDSEKSRLIDEYFERMKYNFLIPRILDEDSQQLREISRLRELKTNNYCFVGDHDLEDIVDLIEDKKGFVYEKK